MEIVFSNMKTFIYLILKLLFWKAIAASSPIYYKTSKTTSERQNSSKGVEH